jgi:hypothetical protein
MTQDTLKLYQYFQRIQSFLHYSNLSLKPIMSFFNLPLKPTTQTQSRKLWDIFVYNIFPKPISNPQSKSAFSSLYFNAFQKYFHHIV